MIDWERVALLREEVGIDDFDEVVELFLTEVDEAVEALDSCAMPDGLADRLHFLKGGALSRGFSDFSTLCQTGEVALHRDPGHWIDLDAIAHSYQKSRAAFIADLPTRITGQTSL